MNKIFTDNLEANLDRARNVTTYEQRRKTLKKKVMTQLAEQPSKKKDHGWFKRFMHYANGADYENM